MPSSVEIVTGGCPVRRLPHTAECAAVARDTTHRALINLLPERVDDCGLMVSELATNAWRHGLGGATLEGGHAPPVGSELAIYRRGPATNAEIVITVFDPDPNVEAIPMSLRDVLASLPDTPMNEKPPPEVVDEGLAELPATFDDPSMSVRLGLDAVRAYSGGRCGFYRTRSRFGAFSGKVAWFAVPATGSLAALPPEVSWSPAEAASALKAQVDARGLDHTYCTNQLGASVLSVRHLTVWCRDQSFQWGTGDQARRIPFYDLVEAAEQIVMISQDADHARLGKPG